MRLGADWERWFDAIVCGEDVSGKKPDPEAYDKVTAALGVSAGTALAAGAALTAGTALAARAALAVAALAGASDAGCSSRGASSARSRLLEAVRFDALALASCRWLFGKLRKVNDLTGHFRTVQLMVLGLVVRGLGLFRSLGLGLSGCRRSFGRFGRCRGGFGGL
ncbi:MAG: HAD hydrolase-like protein [Schleiferiaceae bacterium]